jgi:hypothetical protein
MQLGGFFLLLLLKNDVNFKLVSGLVGGFETVCSFKDSELVESGSFEMNCQQAYRGRGSNFMLDG